MSEYLYKDGKSSHGLVGWYFYDTPRDRTQYRVQSWLAGLSPVMDAYYRDRDNMAYMDDYMKNRVVSWSDVKYPSRTVGWSAGSGAGNAVRSVSRNAMSLYSSDTTRRHRDNERVRRAFNDGRLWEQSYRWHKYKP